MSKNDKMKNQFSRQVFLPITRETRILSIFILVGILQTFLPGNVVCQEMKSSASDKGQIEWPCYLGPNGNFSEGSQIPLIDDMSHIKMLWESEEKAIGFGKTSIGDFPHVTGVFGKLPPGGVSSPIIADGLVIQSYFAPGGTIWDEEIEKTLTKEEFLRDRWLVSADDIVLAIDVATGKTRWKKVILIALFILPPADMRSRLMSLLPMA